MVARISCMALVLGILVGCYNVPTPECGFACGPAGACPASYACNASTNRCELEGALPSCTPAPRSDGGTFPDTPDDFMAPRVIEMLPMPNASLVPLAPLIRATFSEPVLGVSELTMRLELDGTPISGNVVYDSFAQTARFLPSDLLVPGRTYIVTVLDDITDLAGNHMAISEAWTFETAPDTTAPIVIARSPAVDATEVDVGTEIAVDFSEDVDNVTEATMVLRAGAVPVDGTVAYGPSPFGFRAIFTPATQLAADTDYTVSLTGQIADKATPSNPLVPVSWTFTTGPDLQAPIVVARAPLPASAGVAITTNVTAAFDEAVLDVSDTSFTLTPQGGSPVAATVTYDAGMRTATLNPALQLAASTQYTATLTSAITDAATNPLSGAPIAWTFTTGADATAPSVISTTPADLATAVATTAAITVELDEPVLDVTAASFLVNGGAITGTIAMSAGNTVATFTPDAPLPASTQIDVSLTAAITDLAANALAPVAFSFTTAP